jgi:DNA polymerase
MTAEEKNVIAGFLDLAEDCLRDGYIRARKEYAFTSDAPSPAGEERALPLAYMVAEPDENGTGDADASETAAPGENPDDSLETVAGDTAACTACALGVSRNLAVPGEGVPRPLVMIIGEGPGADEDASGRPFVGKAGQLLDKMLASVGLWRNKNCYIANTVKCRPPGNRDPEGEEIAACFPFLERQIRLLKPRVILCAGRVAARTLLKTSEGINSLRGDFGEYWIKPAGTREETSIPVLPTFHPSAILRDESLKRPAWEDLKLLRSKLVSLDKDYGAGEA